VTDNTFTGDITTVSARETCARSRR
jgi:hypothetical protein